MSKTIAIYAGSFSPPTKGHLDIIEKANAVFDKVIIAVGHNSTKTSLFSVDERIDLIKCSMIEYGIPEHNNEVVKFSGLLSGVKT